MNAIDVHCHIGPSEFPAMPPSCLSDQWPGMDHRDNRQAMVMSGKREYRLVDSRCWDPERRTADMNSENIGLQVVSTMPELLRYRIDAQSALVLSRHINGAIADLIEAAPKRIAGLGMVPLQDVEMAAAELASLRPKYGLAGIEIGSNIGGVSPGDERFDPFFAEAERLDLAVFVHALHPMERDRLAGPRQSEPYICHLTDVGFAAASCITGRLIEKFARLRIGFSHGGGTLASFLPHLEAGWKKLKPLNSGFGSPLEAARRFYYDNLAFDSRYLRYLMDIFGDTQIFVGTDYPFTAGQHNSPKSFDALSLSPTRLEAVLVDNASRVLKLDA